MAKFIGYKGELIFEKEADSNDGTLYKSMSRKKFNKLGFESGISLEKGLEAMCQWYMNH